MTQLVSWQLCVPRPCDPRRRCMTQLVSCCNFVSPGLVTHDAAAWHSSSADNFATQRCRSIRLAPTCMQPSI